MLTPLPMPVIDGKALHYKWCKLQQAQKGGRIFRMLTHKANAPTGIFIHVIAFAFLFLIQHCYFSSFTQNLKNNFCLTGRSKQTTGRWRKSINSGTQSLSMPRFNVIVRHLLLCWEQRNFFKQGEIPFSHFRPTVLAFSTTSTVSVLECNRFSVNI